MALPCVSYPRRTIPGSGYQSHVLELTSQTWRSVKDVDRPVWKHWLTNVRPNTLRSSKAFLLIGAGSNNDPAPAKPSDRLVLMATETGTVAAELGMVPNQPLRFTDSLDKARPEDDIIAYSPGTTHHAARMASEDVVRS